MAILEEGHFTSGKVTVVLGTQWGDEGKGKLVDLLAQEADVCARCAGGNNAGHTIVHNNTTFDFHLLPSGLVNEKCISLIGNGVVIHLPGFFQELQKIQAKGIQCEGRLFISDRAHIVLDYHQAVDGLHEMSLGKASLGTTKKGVGPAYSSKAARTGLRIHHLYEWEYFESRVCKNYEHLQKQFEGLDYNIEKELEAFKEFAIKLKPYVVDSTSFIHRQIQEGKKVLVEGANAMLLDIDFGTYPYVTSSSTTIGGVCTGLGLPPKKIGKVVGVCKAYTTRVGAGPFPTELEDELGERLQTIGKEFGATTGRKRRCGWLDLAALKYSHMVNQYSSLCITKLDVLDDMEEIKIGVKYCLEGKELEGFPANLNTLAQVEVLYETLPGWKLPTGNCKTFDELPERAKDYIKRIEQIIQVPVEWIGVGPSRHEMITKQMEILS